jgi:hypothetical protein
MHHHVSRGRFVQSSVASSAARFGRGWTRGRPRKEGAAKTETPVVEGKKAQFSLF